MSDRVLRVVQPAKDRWNGLERAQKIRIIAIIAIVLVALIIAVFLTTRTVYRTAVTGISHVDAMQIASIMSEHGISYQLREGAGASSVAVDQTRLNDARLLIETNGLVADRDFTYEDALNFSGIGVTETVTRNNLLRARQSDLEQALASMDGVLSARVELNLPDANRFFVQTADRATAGVIVRTTRQLSRNEGAAIARFVQRSVMGLDLENIEVIDTDFNVLFSGDDVGSEDGDLTLQQEIAARERIAVTAQVRDLFSHFYDVVAVAPNLALPQFTSESETITFEAPIPEMEGGLLRNEHAHSASASGTSSAFEPGMGSNNLAIPTYPWGMPSDMNARQQEHNRNFALNERIERTRSVNNSYERENSSITVNLAHFVFYDQALLRSEQNITESEWQELRRNTRHEPNTDEALIAHYTALVRTATGIENVTVMSWIVPQFVDYVPTPINYGALIMYAILALLLLFLAIALIRKTQPEEEEEIEPELSVEDLLVSTQMEEALEEEQLEPIGYNEDSECKQKLEVFIDDKPDAAASLLRHWLNEAEV
ncbi:MAG: hypothetical protein FWC91_00475 [Defluviitaleaceae bacterium]|nr:hypothetical protein [Defluviitaleaceae bacterium]